MLTDDEKMRARHHLGYMNVNSAPTFNLGIPAAVQTAFMVEDAWAKIMPEAETQFRVILCRLDMLEEHFYSNTDMIDVLKVGNLEINPKRLSEYSKMYRYARSALANLLGIVPNPFDQRDLANGGGGSVGNVPVM